MRKTLLAIIVLGACGTNDNSVPLVAGFTLPALDPSYERYITQPIDAVAPGADVNYCQWVAAPSTVDRQVDDLKHYQSLGGHHLVLYATTKNEAIGTTRICTTDDMLSVNFLGGGEGTVTSAVQLPGGYAFDLPAGQSLLINDHYVNATDKVLDVQSAVDIKIGDPNAPLKPVGFVAVNFDQFTIPAESDTTVDAYCTAPSTLSFFMWGNHMHQLGFAEYSELIHPDATTTMMENNTTWSPDQTFNTPWVEWDPTTPFVVNAGDVFHLNCTWHNTTSADVLFPTEMCVATGFTLEAMPQAVCEAQPTIGAS